MSPDLDNLKLKKVSEHPITFFVKLVNLEFKTLGSTSD